MASAMLSSGHQLDGAAIFRSRCGSRRARPYRAELGRFLRVDPIEGGTTTNDYGYVRDPINQYDLTGRGLRSWIKKKAKAVVKVVRAVGRGVVNVSRAASNAPWTAVATAWPVANHGSCRMRGDLRAACTGVSQWANGPADALTIGNTMMTERKKLDSDMYKQKSAHINQRAVMGVGFVPVFFAGEIASRAAGCGSCLNPMELLAPEKGTFLEDC
jgi:RHS repeat-associated protein